MLPPHALADLKLQRTGYKSWPEADIARHFTEAVDGHAELLRKYCGRGDMRQSVLDIGCGIGFGILAFARAFGTDHDFTGIDRDDRTGLFYGFAENAASYNSLETTRDVLAANGVIGVRLFDAGTHGIPDGCYDTVLSTLAYGFHFPVAVYLDRILACTKPGSVLAADIRLGTDGFDALRPHFEDAGGVNYPKYRRSIFIRR